jgi:hypothetical protein
MFLISVVGLLIPIEQVSDDKLQFLTNGNSKSWILVKSPEAECKQSSKIAEDNLYTFYANGTFEFDHGTLTEDSSCDDCCNDFVNIVGEWKFTGNKKGLRVTTLHEKGNKANAKTMVIYDATIDQLSEDVLIISQKDKETGTTYTMEFRKK